MRILVSFALLGLLACHSSQHDHAPADHDKKRHEDHGPAAVGITTWSAKLELFAEHLPGVVGKDLLLFSHLTVLEGFRALEAGEVTLILEGPETLTGTVKKAYRSGIFRPLVKPTKAGTYRGRMVVSAPGVVEDTIDGFEVIVYENEAAAAAAAAAAGGEAASSTIAFLKEQQWKVPFDTAFASKQPLVPTFVAAGEVVAPPGKLAEITAPVSGRVLQAPMKMPSPGDSVRKNDVLFLIAPTPTAPEDAARARLAVSEASSRLSAARSRLERAERLIKDQAIPAREVEDASREAKLAEASVAAARAAAQVFSSAASGSGGATWRVTAPISGIITQVTVSIGASLPAGAPLLQILDASELWLRARVPEADAARLRVEYDASFRVAGGEAWVPLVVTGAAPTARLVFVGRTVDPVSRTVDVVYALEKPDATLRVGGMVDLSLPSGPPLEGVVVPRDAVVDDAGRQVVYVQVEGEAFEERAVRTGARAGDRVAIVSGLNPGERVVVRGGNLVRLASRANTSAGHGHVH